MFDGVFPIYRIYCQFSVKHCKAIQKHAGEDFFNEKFLLTHQSLNSEIKVDGIMRENPFKVESNFCGLSRSFHTPKKLLCRFHTTTQSRLPLQLISQIEYILIILLGIYSAAKWGPISHKNSHKKGTNRIHFRTNFQF